ncbi:hypothetical protein [Streptomyces huasconensis]|uniref:hypothetical protein n=1 Tax=Streptomyces huasconensis TaxID=1854574 RepID=UPI0036FEDB49
MSERGEGDRPVRGIGETAWRQARKAAHLSEMRYHEWLLNRTFAQSPAWSMLCPLRHRRRRPGRPAVSLPLPPADPRFRRRHPR